ncbi:hypothetical protein LSTR_LSTR010188 [Laodelphax striatellus]|uniref:Uncharacterized protein n=1 Tax=Laodelphax striatellus TaxID=195883 RepID=A0A482WPJ0_LAOST|nr:hypothetical protein LSTR_LSTR010188 [Laodelphax striatellus]
MGCIIGCLGWLAPCCPTFVSTVGGWLGFSAVGPVAGSVAAGAQAAVGSVAAGSAFAAVQSVAMTTAAVSTPWLAAIGASIMGAFGGLVAIFK